MRQPAAARLRAAPTHPLQVCSSTRSHPTPAVSSHFSRLIGHARRRSRRRDYPPLRGTSLNLFKVRALSGSEAELAAALLLLSCPLLPATLQMLQLVTARLLLCRWTTRCEGRCTT